MVRLFFCTYLYASLFRLFLNKHPLCACGTCARVFILIYIYIVIIIIRSTQQKLSFCFASLFACNNIHRAMLLSFLHCSFHPSLTTLNSLTTYTTLRYAGYLLTTYYLIYNIVRTDYILTTYSTQTINRPFATVSRYLLAFQRTI